VGHIAIIISGLPASGKTSVARALAAKLNIQLFDKDDFLERLYDQHGVSDWNSRKRLSRQSDKDFQIAAVQANTAVLVSHWRPNNTSAITGTPTEWVAKTFETVIEIYCECTPAMATQRFLARQRHPGHLDSQRDPGQLAQQMLSLSDGYPLGLGPVVQVNTERKVNFENLLEQLAQQGVSRGQF
jgi:cytidylate kinase